MRQLTRLPRMTAVNIHAEWTQYKSVCWPRERHGKNNHKPDEPAFYFYKMLVLIPNVTSLGHIRHILR
jgi:hypothetical protein